MREPPAVAVPAHLHNDNRANCPVPTTSSTFDVVIAGAGPAGSSAAAVLANQSVPLEECEDNLCLSLRHFSDVGDVAQRNRLIDWIFLQRKRNPRGFFHFRITTAEEVSLNAPVLDAVEHRTKRGKSITSGPSCFLVVRFDRAGEVIVHDESNVLLVDAEPECIRGDDRLDVAVHESVLNCFSIRRGALAVIQAKAVTIRELIVEPLRLLHCRNVDDAGSRCFGENVLDDRILDPIVHCAPNFESKIRPGESGDRHVRVVHPELANDVVLDFLRSSSGECQYRWPSQTFRDRSERQIVRPEVVTPLAYAVCLVDYE